MQITSAMCGAARRYGPLLGGLSLILALVTADVTIQVD
jgi:hypothetical protein